MSYYFNKITDMIKNKVYVDSGPLEEPSVKKNKKLPTVPEKDEHINQNNQSHQSYQSNQTNQSMLNKPQPNNQSSLNQNIKNNPIDLTENTQMDQNINNNKTNTLSLEKIFCVTKLINFS